jgi:hypothetical protein
MHQRTACTSRMAFSYVNDSTEFGDSTTWRLPLGNTDVKIYFGE